MIHLSWEPIEGAREYELMVYDRTDARTLVNETVAGVAVDVSLTDEQLSHDLVMRVRGLRDGAWGEWTQFEPLPIEGILGQRRPPVSDLSSVGNPGLLLLFTVDTECSVLRQPAPNPDRVVDELIFGDFGDDLPPAGIGLHMDLLEHFGYRGCFFVDVLMEFQFGQRALERTIEAITGRGHEVQLHIHSDHLAWSSDSRISRLSGALGSDDPNVFRQVMELGVDLFERRVGHHPVAYRAGGYRITDAHFPVLEELGIRIDSSVQPYYNSRVSDWMRTRTQPFWVGGVLEVPPTWVLLNDNPKAWEVRGFQPNPDLGDPVSSLPVEPEASPQVATYVSHSFQLLRRRETRDPERIEAFTRQVRGVLPADLADRMLAWPLQEVRTFGKEVDERLVAPVAGLLRRIADRPDARCTTYGELAGVANRFWFADRHQPVDPIPLLDRRRGIRGVTSTRILSRDFFARLREQSQAISPKGSKVDQPPIIDLEDGVIAGLRKRLISITTGSEAQDPLSVRVHTLGVAPPHRREGLPELAELVFPVTVVQSATDEALTEPFGVVAWDVPTLRAWLERRGFEVMSERRVPRHPEGLAAIERFADKLRWLDSAELRTEAWEAELRVPVVGRIDHVPPVELAVEVSDGKYGQKATLPPFLEPELLPRVAERLFSSAPVGTELWLEMVDEVGPATNTTCLLAMMRAGFEVLDKDERGYRLIRPVELEDVRRFAGLEPAPKAY